MLTTSTSRSRCQARQTSNPSPGTGIVMGSVLAPGTKVARPTVTRSGTGTTVVAGRAPRFGEPRLDLAPGLDNDEGTSQPACAAQPGWSRRHSTGGRIDAAPSSSRQAC